MAHGSALSGGGFLGKVPAMSSFFPGLAAITGHLPAHRSGFAPHCNIPTPQHIKKHHFAPDHTSFTYRMPVSLPDKTLSRQ